MDRPCCFRNRGIGPVRRCHELDLCVCVGVVRCTLRRLAFPVRAWRGPGVDGVRTAAAHGCWRAQLASKQFLLCNCLPASHSRPGFLAGLPKPVGCCGWRNWVQGRNSTRPEIHPARLQGGWVLGVGGSRLPPPQTQTPASRSSPLSPRSCNHKPSCSVMIRPAT